MEPFVVNATMIILAAVHGMKEERHLDSLGRLKSI